MSSSSLLRIAPLAASLAFGLAGCSNPAAWMSGMWGSKSPRPSVGAPAPGPSLSPNSGIYTGNQSLVISDSGPGAQIVYSLDGSMPNGTYAKHASPFTLSLTGQAFTYSILAVAEVPGMADSAPASGIYYIDPNIDLVSVTVNYPVGIAIAPNDDVYVADTNNNRILEAGRGRLELHRARGYGRGFSETEAPPMAPSSVARRASP